MFKFYENNKDKIKGYIGCFDRIRLKGHLDGYSYPGAMEHHLYKEGVKIFDYAKYAEGHTIAYKHYVKDLSKRTGVDIQYVQSYHIDKEAIVQSVLKERGNSHGLVHIIAAVESARIYQPSYDQAAKKAKLKSRFGKCLHYYFYFIDAQLGLCYFRVPTWFPFGVQFYCNGHHYLFEQLDKKKVSYTSMDNALIDVENFKRAQRISDTFTPELVMKRLSRLQERYCPMLKWFNTSLYWTIDQVEYSTDFVFNNKAALKPLYENLTKQALYTVKPDNVYSFLGKKLTGNYLGELGNDFKGRDYGTRLKHYSDGASIKMYDKFGLLLRVETTINDVSFFSAKRTIDKRDGTSEEKMAPLKKSLFSLSALRSLMFNSNKRYLDFIGTLDDPTEGQKNLEKVTKKLVENGRGYRGLNFFNQKDKQFIEAINDPKFCTVGISNKDIRNKAPNRTTGQVSRMLKNLRLRGIIKKMPNQYRYVITQLGRAIINAGMQIIEITLPEKLVA